MKKRTLAMIITAIILAQGMIIVHAEAATGTITIPNKYLQPGDTFTVTGSAEPRVNATVKLTASNGETITHIITVPGTGQFSREIQLHSEMRLDVYTVTLIVDDTVIATGEVIVSGMMQRDVINNMIQALQQLHQQLKTQIARMEANGEAVPPAVRESYQLALQAISEAKTLWDDGQTTATLEQAQRAQKHFQNAFRLIETQEDTEPEQIQVRAQAAERALKEVRRLETTLDSINSKGIDTPLLRQALIEAERNLQLSIERYNERDLQAGDSALRTAVEQLRQVNAGIQRVTETIKAQLAAKYKERFQDRINQLRDIVDTYQEKLDGTDRARLLAALQETEGKLEQVQENLDIGTVDMEELEEISDDIEEAVNMIRSEQTRNTLNEMDWTQAQVQALTERQEALKEKFTQALRAKLLERSRQLQILRDRMQSLNTTSIRPSDSGDTPTNSTDELSPSLGGN
ncbi:MAG: hypothetical protein NWE89_07520 [Candidatus Bathyarchaeota archaeon]|nr:hypothetical protein [Candidatus Bathyarchaeota archaeon]